jgi:hypothetical protein
MEAARKTGDRLVAQRVATECVVLAETKDHFNWSLIGEVAQQLEGRQREMLMSAYVRIEKEEDEHLYRMQGWCRELWLQSLGLDAEFPPVEEKQDATSAVEAQLAREARHPHH